MRLSTNASPARVGCSIWEGSWHRLGGGNSVIGRKRQPWQAVGQRTVCYELVARRHISAPMARKSGHFPCWWAVLVGRVGGPEGLTPTHPSVPSHEHIATTPNPGAISCNRTLKDGALWSPALSRALVGRAPSRSLAPARTLPSIGSTTRQPLRR